VRWEEPRDPDRSPPPRRWGIAAAVAGLGIALVAGATLLPDSPPASSPSGTVAVETVHEPTGRGGLSHRVPTAPTTARAPAPVVVEPVAEAAATTSATTAAPVVGRVGQLCDVPGTTAIAGDGGPLVCQGGNGNGAPRWRKA
jgi:hypothetical protein